MVCLGVVLLWYRIACLWFCHKRFCNKNGSYLCRSIVSSFYWLSLTVTHFLCVWPLFMVIPSFWSGTLSSPFLAFLTENWGSVFPPGGAFPLRAASRVFTHCSIITARISAPCIFPWFYHFSHIEDFPARKPRHVFKGRCVVINVESSCSLAWVPGVSGLC